MSKKLVRISFDHLDTCIENALWINIVLENGVVHYVQPIKVIANILKVKNKMGGKMNLLLTQIDEIWADIKVS